MKLDPHVSHHRARIAGLSRDREADDPEFIAAKRDLAAAKLAAAVEKCLATAPRPTDEQLSRIAALLRAGSGDSA